MSRHLWRIDARPCLCMNAVPCRLCMFCPGPSRQSLFHPAVSDSSYHENPTRYPQYRPVVFTPSMPPSSDWQDDDTVLTTHTACFSYAQLLRPTVSSTLKTRPSCHSVSISVATQVCFHVPPSRFRAASVPAPHPALLRASVQSSNRPPDDPLTAIHFLQRTQHCPPLSQLSHASVCLASRLGNLIGGCVPWYEKVSPISSTSQSLPRICPSPARSIIPAPNFHASQNP